MIAAYKKKGNKPLKNIEDLMLKIKHDKASQPIIISYDEARNNLPYTLIKFYE